MAGFQLPSFNLLLVASIAIGVWAYSHDPALPTVGQTPRPRVGVVKPEPRSVRSVAQPVVIRVPDAPTPRIDVGEPQLVSFRLIPVCGTARRVTCVVDGDTIWVRSEKIRLDGVDAPEVQGRCRHETKLAAKATSRLSQLLSGKAFSIERHGRDRHGRTLAKLKIGNDEVGAILVREGLAKPWLGRKATWC